MLRRVGRPAVVESPSAAVRMPPDRRPMTPDAVSAVLARNSMASIIQDFDKGRVRTRRTPYAYASDALYLPAWRHPKWFRRDPPMIVECHVSELLGLEAWSYVWAHGVATPLQASGDAVENEAWAAGVHCLRRVIRSSSRVTEPAFMSYGIVRVDISVMGGVSLHIG